jgi:hypothetical protein
MTSTSDSERSTARPPDPDRPNPYVGPRAFRETDRLYGRDREASEVTDRLISERIVLLHAPSGAGKTSLMQAEIRPRLQAEHFHVFGPIRLNAVPPPGVANRFVWSVAVALLRPERPDDPALHRLSLEDVVTRVEASVGSGSDDVVFLFDQIEEVLTLDPTDVDTQREFFRQLGAVLERDTRWALLSIREDYMGGLDRFVECIPGRLAAAYRLDFLRLGPAAVAVAAPARAAGVEFEDEAVDAIVEDLSRIKVQRPGHEIERISGPYVEPVQLQVVCHQLWRTLKKERGDSFERVRLEDVTENLDLSTRALRKFYDHAVKDVAAATGCSQRAIRSWIDTELITRQGFRSQTRTGPDVDAAAVLEQLEDRYVIRSDTRGGVTWYELAHDRLVEPIRDSNDAWNQRRLRGWQRSAEEWRRNNRDSNYLLRGQDYFVARSSGPALRGELTDNERDFLEESKKIWHQQRLTRRISRLMLVLLLIVVAETILIVVLLILLNG